MSKSVPNYVKTLQKTPKSISGENSVILGHSLEVSDLIKPRMPFDNLDTWRVINSQFVGTYSKSDICFAPHNEPEAQDSCKIRIITTEMSPGNGPWHA